MASTLVSLCQPALVIQIPSEFQQQMHTKIGTKQTSTTTFSTPFPPLALLSFPPSSLVLPLPLHLLILSLILPFCLLILCFCRFCVPSPVDLSCSCRFFNNCISS